MSFEAKEGLHTNALEAVKGSRPDSECFFMVLFAKDYDLKKPKVDENDSNITVICQGNLMDIVPESEDQLNEIKKFMLKELLEKKLGKAIREAVQHIEQDVAQEEAKTAIKQ